jgi:hypothetical protein
MDIVPVRPQPLVRSGSATSRTTSRATATKAVAPKKDDAVAPGDVELLAQQAAFDRMMQIRAELQREANALRDLAMEQVKRDDSVMNQWIKLI